MNAPGLRVDARCANELPAKLAEFAILGAGNHDFVYSPLILNTVLIMFYLFRIFGNLFISMDVSQTGGYQLTLGKNHDGLDYTFESESDKVINDHVNALVNDFIRTTGKDKIAVSLMFIDPANPANNHANMILFHLVVVVDDKGIEVRVWHAYHYETHGRKLAQFFPGWAATGKNCIRVILGRHGILEENIHTHIQTRIRQTLIDSIQGTTEGGYCQIISALNAWLFLLFCRTNLFNPNKYTPLGSHINSPIDNGGNASENARYQLQIIRGFVIYISQEINILLSAVDIDFRITRISQINHYYNSEQIRTGIRRPLYLYYLNTAFDFITNEVIRGNITLTSQCVQDCGPIGPQDIPPKDFSQLNTQVTPLLGLLNGIVVLTKAAKIQIYNKCRDAARQEAARIAAAAKARPAAAKAAAKAAAANAKKIVGLNKVITAKIMVKEKNTGGTRKYKRRKTKNRRHKNRKTMKRRKPTKSRK
jgi:hypothetical protein